MRNSLGQPGRCTPHLPPAEAALGIALEEFGASHQIEVCEGCIAAVRRPTSTVQEITTGRTAGELLAKLRAERDGAS